MSILTPKSAKKELVRRELAALSRPIDLDPNFTAQNKFVMDTSRYIVAQCSRRAGKSNGLALRFFKAMEKHPGSACIYLSMTRESAKNILWPALQELNETYKIGCKFTDSNLIIKHPNGSKLTLYGADMSNFIKRLKGQKSPAIAIDEAQDFGPHLESLINDVLTPMMIDYEDSWLAITGTPGPVPQGYFYDITQGRKYGYSFHDWTLLDNPYLVNPKEFIEDLKRKREWRDDNPTLLREWQNHWVLDVKSLWIQYDAEVGHFEELPVLPGNDKYHYILGVDWGFKDADALAVLAYSDHGNVTYLVDEIVTTKQDITALVEQVQALRTKYDISKIVMDEGGGGKKMAEEMRRRFSIPVEPAEKTRKQETVDFLNDAMRRGRFRAKRDSRFAKDSYLIQIDWDKSRPDKITIKKNYHSDIIDACIYSFKCSPAYAYEKPVEPPKIGSEAWAAMQQGQMWEEAMGHFQEEAEKNKRIYGDRGD